MAGHGAKWGTKDSHPRGDNVVCPCKLAQLGSLPPLLALDRHSQSGGLGKLCCKLGDLWNVLLGGCYHVEHGAVVESNSGPSVVQDSRLRAAGTQWPLWTYCPSGCVLRVPLAPRSDSSVHTV